MRTSLGYFILIFFLFCGCPKSYNTVDGSGEILTAEKVNDQDKRNRTQKQKERFRSAPSAGENWAESFLPAFPGAEGFGAKSRGGRGGRVIYVENLNDSGPGSLRAAVEAKGARTILFKVSGTIRLKSRLQIRNPYITIAGQTAPGDGICLRDYPLNIYGPAHDVIIRGIRSRHGDDTDAPRQKADAIGLQAEKPEKPVSDVIIDHCSLSWGIDENFQVWDYCKNVTLQWSIISEGLDNAGHPDGGPHSNAALVMSGFDGGGITMHHNLIAHHRSRNPKFAGNQWDTTATSIYDFRNNVVYNYMNRPGMSGKRTVPTKIRVNFCGNYYKFGPSTTRSHRSSLLLLQYKNDAGYYLSENYIFGSSEHSRDNWAAVHYWRTENNQRSIQLDAPIPCPPITQQSPLEAYELVLAQAGCSYPVRDAVDRRIVSDVRNNTGKIIDSQYEVGGWPILRSAKPPLDSDNDGMPDEWEALRGLNAQNPLDGNMDDDGDGYTNLEEYINGLIPLPY